MIETKKVKAKKLESGDYVILDSNDDSSILSDGRVIARILIKRTWLHKHKRIIVKRLAHFTDGTMGVKSFEVHQDYLLNWIKKV